MKRVVVAIALTILFVLALPICNSEEASRPILTLIITGRDVGGHQWRETTPAIRKILEETKKFEVFVCEDPAILESKQALSKYSLIILNYFNFRAPTISDTAKDNLAAFLKGGKGFVTLHLASASFSEWDEFHKMVGRWWVMGKSGHGPRGEFTANIVDKNHPITTGMTDFDADDELYAKLLGEGPIHVLVSAYSGWSKKVEPLAFTLLYGRGRVYHHCFGHDVKAIVNPPVARLLARGAEWAATGKVSGPK
jgi:type 1 glutamine amidotransferase